MLKVVRVCSRFEGTSLGVGCLHLVAQKKSLEIDDWWHWCSLNKLMLPEKVSESGDESRKNGTLPFCLHDDLSCRSAIWLCWKLPFKSDEDSCLLQHWWWLMSALWTVWKWVSYTLSPLNICSAFVVSWVVRTEVLLCLLGPGLERDSEPVRVISDIGWALLFYERGTAMEEIAPGRMLPFQS